MKNLSKAKKISIISLVFLSVASFVYIVCSSRKSPPQEGKTPASSQNSPSPASKAVAGKTNGSYFLNTIDNIEVPVTGYSWDGNVLVYSTPNSIVRTDTETPVLKQSIDSIDWSANGQALLKSQNDYFYFDGKAATKLSLAAGIIKISPDGKKILNSSGTKITLSDYSSENSEDIKTDAPVSGVFWAAGNGFFAISYPEQLHQKVRVFGPNLTEQPSLIIPSRSRLLGVTDDGKVLIQEESSLLVKDGGSGIFTFVFTKNSSLDVYPENDGDLIVIETFKDYVDRRVNNIWKVSKTGTLTLLTNSYPVVGRINPKIALFENRELLIIPFVENNSGLWILSLAPNVVPVYKKGGVTKVPVDFNSKGF